MLESRGEHAFDDMMADQLRRTPWLGLSLVLHEIVFLVLWLMPVTPPVVEQRAVAVQPLDTPEQIVVEKDPEVPIEPPPTAEPTLQAVDVAPVTDDVRPDFTDFENLAAVDSAFASQFENSAIGIAGHAGSPFGGRAGGRETRGPGRHVAENIALALDWLVDHQDDDGRWDADGFMKHDEDGPACDGPGNAVHDVGITGLALLAFLGDGSTLRSGPYREPIKRGIRWMLEQQDPDTGLIGSRSSNEFVYDHAIAALALVEAFGLSESRLLENPARKAVGYLESHRNPYRVWRYQPRDGDNDTSVTGWCVLVYKSAKEFGLPVNDQALKLAETWLDEMTDDVGRTGYTERGGRSSRRVGDHAVLFPREKGECMTAVSLLCRFFLGHDPKQSPIMATQADLILEQPPVWNETDGSVDHYYWYYGTYALFQIGGRHWQKWEAALQSAVVATQRNDGNFRGSWDPAGAWGADGGRVYSTALLCLTLEAYYRYPRFIR